MGRKEDMQKANKMHTRHEIIKMLKYVGDIWMDDLILISDSSSLVLVDATNGEELDYFKSIRNDGGCPDKTYVGDKTYHIDYMKSDKCEEKDE